VAPPITSAGDGTAAPPSVERAPITPSGRDDAPALITEDGTVSHSTLREMVRRTAEELAGPRRLAMVRARRDVDSVVAYLGAMEAGHPVLLTSERQLPGGADECFSAGLTFDGDRGWESTGRTDGEIHPDLALLLSTSGSTGSPKLVRLSKSNVASNAAAIAQYLHIGPDDRALATLPLHYCYGLSVLNSHMVAGAAVVLTEAGVVDPCCWELARDAGATSFAGVPHTFTLLERRGIDCVPATVRTVTQAGGRMPADGVRRWADHGVRRGFDFVVMYGQTEATARMAWLPPELAKKRPEAIGVPIPGGRFHLDGKELVYSGPNVMMGYALEQADLARGAEVDELHTGDLARQAADGLWEITGRANRFAKPLGLRVDLERLEDTIADSGIRASCVALTASDDTTELVGIMVETGERPGTAGETAIRAVCAASELPRAAVQAIEVGSLPRTESDKIDLEAVRSGILEQLRSDTAGTGSRPSGGRPPEGGADGEADAPTVAHQPDATAAVAAVFSAALPVGEVDPSVSFVDLGGDSLSYVEVSMELEKLLGTLPPDWHLLTVSELGALATAAGKPRLARVEVGGVLRAVGILMVVSRHVQLTDLGGGAHVLMALSGFNFSRFPLTASMRDGRYTRLFGAALRVAVPTALWLAAVVLLTGGYSWANVGFLNAVFGPDSWGDTWRYWYLEALVQILVAMALLFSVPAVRRGASRLPFLFPLLLTGAALVVRFGIVEYGHEHRQVNLATGVAWLFMVGWAAHRAETVPRRLLVTAIALAALPGWFGEPARELTIAVALLGIIWLREIPLPRFLVPVVGVVGGASMWIYLTHWQVYPPLEDSVSPVLLLVLSILTGVLAQHLWDWGSGRVTALWNRWAPARLRRVQGAYPGPVRRSTRNEPAADTSSKRPLSNAGR
jgi:acyl carrier protein